MQDIDPIYHNQFGLAFYWRTDRRELRKRVQIVFRDTGLLLQKEELEQFATHIQKLQSHVSHCQDCSEADAHNPFLLDTPVPQLSLMVNKAQLQGVSDLVAGTLFHMGLEAYLGRLCTD